MGMTARTCARKHDIRRDGDKVIGDSVCKIGDAR